MACPMYERVALFLIMFSIRLLDYMARKQVQSESAGPRRRSRAGCLAGYTSSYGLSQMGFDWPGCTSLVALLVGLESLLLYRPAGL